MPVRDVCQDKTNSLLQMIARSKDADRLTHIAATAANHWWPGTGKLNKAIIKACERRVVQLVGVEKARELWQVHQTEKENTDAA